MRPWRQVRPTTRRNVASFRAYPDGSTAGQNEMALHSLASQIIDFNGRIPSELRTALTAIREARGTVELLAKLTGGLRGSESEEQIPGSEPTVEELRSLVVSGMEIQQRRREPDSRTVEAAGYTVSSGI